MIPDNSMENRLNAVKNGEEPPEVKSNDAFIEHLLETNKLIDDSRGGLLYEELLLGLSGILDVLLASALYGYAFKAIFSIDWAMLEVVGVGFLINNAITLASKLLLKFINRPKKS